jgi:hypothetical protein
MALTLKNVFALISLPTAKKYQGFTCTRAQREGHVEKEIVSTFDQPLQA